MIECDEIISVMDIVSTKILNTIAIFLIAILCIQFISEHITIDNYYYLLSLCKTKMYLCTNIIKWEKNEFRKFVHFISIR